MDSLRFIHIQTSKVLYYDPAFRSDCYRFCLERNIDCLPSLDDPRRYYARDDSRKDFEERAIESARVISEKEDIFQPDVLEQFRANHLLFVATHGEPTGVVHFSDYNRPVVHSYLYTLLFDYENALRRLLICNDLSNDDMLEFIKRQSELSDNASNIRNKYKRKLGVYLKYHEEISTLPTFQSFELDDLIELILHHKIIDINSEVTKLRNDVMHAHQFIYRDQTKSATLFFKFDVFAAFFRNVRTLHHDLRRVANRISFLMKDSLDSQ